MSGMDAIKPRVRALPHYTLAALETQVKLNQNENPYDLPGEVKEEVLRLARERPWSRYPEFVPDEFLHLLADHAGWRREGMLAGNGSNELIQALFAVTAEPGRTVLVVQPTFTLYRLMAGINGAEVVSVLLRTSDLSFDLAAILAAIEEHRPSVVVVCSPNNPTGSVLSADEISTICAAAPGIVAVDQAYVEFGGESAIPLLGRHGNLVVLRTFSKAGGLAGLRVGYCATSRELTTEIGKAKLPYNLDFFSMAAATAVVRNWPLMQKTIDLLIEERERVREALSNISGVRTYPSAANFLLFETDMAPSEVFAGVYGLGVLIRDVSKYPLLGKALRVSIGTPGENDAFLKAIRTVMEER